MIIDPVTLPLTAKWQMLKCHERIWNGGIPIIDEEHRLKES
jgi:hypothetical protein